MAAASCWNELALEMHAGQDSHHGRERLFGAIEAGGTKFVCGIGTGPDNLRTVRIPTTAPESTIAEAIRFFQSSEEPVQAIGIGSFGPVDLHVGSPTYGYITSTPKPAWRNTDIAGAVADAMGVPVGFDTDVNAAVLGEGRWGAAVGLSDSVYLTVGTGIGGGALVGGSVLHGLVHPEMGHIRIPHDRSVDPFPGICPFHGDCLEGLASGPAMHSRWGAPPDQLPEHHPAWSLEAHYLALGLVSWICTLSSQRIILGGGVMQQSRLFPMIRKELSDLLNGYIQARALTAGLDTYIVPPKLGGRAGILGALVLAEEALNRQQSRSDNPDAHTHHAKSL
jgi:fructokinase